MKWYVPELFENRSASDNLFPIDSHMFILVLWSSVSHQKNVVESTWAIWVHEQHAGSTFHSDLQGCNGNVLFVTPYMVPWTWFQRRAFWCYAGLQVLLPTIPDSRIQTSLFHLWFMVGIIVSEPSTLGNLKAPAFWPSWWTCFPSEPMIVLQYR